MKSTWSKRSETLEEASWSREGLNIRSLAFMVNAFAPLLITAAEVSDRPGRIVGFNFGSGVQNTPAYVASSASKASLFCFAHSVMPRLPHCRRHPGRHRSGDSGSDRLVARRAADLRDGPQRCCDRDDEFDAGQ